MSNTREAVKSYLDCMTKAQDYIAKVPSEFYTGIVENPYIEHISDALDIVFELTLGRELLNEVEWFLYDWKHGNTIQVTTSSGAVITYKIDTLEDFMSYLDAEYSL
jgi:hypothetical protein